MPVDNSDYLDPDAFSSPIATPRTYSVHLVLEPDEETRLYITLHREAQRYELQASNRESEKGGSDKLAVRMRERADITRTLLNKYRAAAGMPPMTPAEILDW